MTNTLLRFRISRGLKIYMIIISSMQQVSLGKVKHKSDSQKL